jgi:hypothetical protein
MKSPYDRLHAEMEFWLQAERDSHDTSLRRHSEAED